MKKKLQYLTILYFSGLPLAIFSQFNIGIGVGQQYYGLPGVRAGYYWKALEPSVNAGVYYSKTVDVGMGLSVYFHDQTKIHKKISYNFDLVFNPKAEIMRVHSLTANLEFYSRKIIPIQWRIGLGARYTNYKFFPAATFGYFIDFKDLIEKGFHINFKNKLGKE